MSQNIWFEATAGRCYEIKLKNEMSYIYKANGQNIIDDLNEIDISGSEVREIVCNTVKYFGWQEGSRRV